VLKAILWLRKQRAVENKDTIMNKMLAKVWTLRSALVESDEKSRYVIRNR
jgi:hypothetical protein